MREMGKQEQGTYRDAIDCCCPIAVIARREARGPSCRAGLFSSRM